MKGIDLAFIVIDILFTIVFSVYSYLLLYSLLFTQLTYERYYFLGLITHLIFIVFKLIYL